jgi:predicted nucleic acid-binding protein
MIYLDTSVFVSLYSRDIHMAKAKRIFAVEPRVWLTPLHECELTHALYSYAFRKELTLDQVKRLYSLFEADSENLWIKTGIPPEAYELAVSLGKKHQAKLGMRTLDTLHVSCALVLNAEAFSSFDERQTKLAKTEGLKLIASS